MGSVHQGHRARQRKKLLENGPRAFADHELLEMLLYYAIPRRDTNELAHRLLERFGSLQGVFSAPVEELSTVEGVGENAAVLLNLVPQIWLWSLQGAPERILNSVDKCGEYFAELLSGSRREMLWQVCLDGKGKLLSCRCITKGTVTSSPLQVRQVVENALYSGADSVLLAHNHPSGVALPSQADVVVTRQVREALAPLGIVLRDHIIVADRDYVSMAESGLLAD